MFRTEVGRSRFQRVLMMVYNTRNYWGFGLCQLSSIIKPREQLFWRLCLFPSSGEGDTPILLGPLERAVLTE
jgi:hypothetical protein